MTAADFLGDALEASGLTKRSGISDLRQLAGGESAETWRFHAALGDRGAADYVARWYRSSGTSSAFGDLRREFVALRAAAEAGVPAPLPAGLVEGVLSGRPVSILVTELMPGEATSPWNRRHREAVAALRAKATFRRAFVEQMVQIHKTPVPSEIAASDRLSGRTLIARELKRSLQDLVENGFDDDPVLVYVYHWIRRREPDLRIRDDELVHGDYRLGNLLVEHSRITAVIDWESAQSGDGLYDLAWLVSPLGIVDGLSSGLCEPAELVDLYAATRRRQVGKELQALAALAMLRNFSSWIALARPGDPETWSKLGLRRYTSALRVRAQCVLPIFGGDDFYRSPVPAGQANHLSAAADTLRARYRSTADLTLDGALGLLRNLGRSPGNTGPFELARRTSSYLASQGSSREWPDRPVDIAFCDWIRAMADRGDERVFGDSGPIDPVLRSLMSDWSSVEAGWLLSSPRMRTGT